MTQQQMMMKHELTEAKSEMEETNEDIKEMTIQKGNIKNRHSWKKHYETWGIGLRKQAK